MAILRCFTPQAQEFSARELAEATGLPRPTLFRLLDTLCELGLLRYSERLSKYVPGVGLLNLSAPVLARMTVRQLARPMMAELARHIDGLVHLSVGSEGALTYVEVAQGEASRVARPEIGVHVSLSRTAQGRAWLCAMTGAERERALARLDAKDPARGPWLRERLDDARRDLERHGFCRSHGDLYREVESIAVPMQRPHDGVAWIFGATVPVFGPQIERLESDVGPRLIALVRSVEAALGSAA